MALFRDEYKVPVLPPEIAAAMAHGFEIGCSMLLDPRPGLAARHAADARHAHDHPALRVSSAWPEHLVWGSILLFLLTRGPGAISIDRLIGLESSDSLTSQS